MRTKTLLLTAAVAAAGIATSMAQVYSVNAVGYVNKTIPVQPTGFTFAILANPLNGTNNNIATVLPSVPDGTVVYVFRGSPPSYSFETYLGGGLWFPGTTDLAPGEGFFIQLDPASAPNPTTITFVGEVPQGTLANSVPAGFSMRASMVPQQGGVETVLGLPANVGDTLFQFDAATQSYSFKTALGGGVWFDAEPVIGVADGFFYQNQSNPPAAINWSRTFTVN